MDHPYSISRHNSKQRQKGFSYECESCGQEANTVASIAHTDSCTISQLRLDKFAYDSPSKNTKLHLPFSDTTVNTIAEIAHEFFMTAEYGERTFDETFAAMESMDGVKWTAQGSTSRYILGLGRTTRYGEFHREDKRGLVLKISPRIRYNTEHTPIDANIEEIQAWKVANETGTEQFFADIFTTAPDGMWLVMEECLPIYPSVDSAMQHRDGLYDQDKSTYINPLRDILQNNGWSDPDHKYGNIGLTDNNKPVLIDYGTSVVHESEDRDQPRF